MNDTTDKQLQRAAAYAEVHKQTVPRISDLKWTAIHGRTQIERKAALDKLQSSYYNLPYINRRK